MKRISTLLTFVLCAAAALPAEKSAEKSADQPAACATVYVPPGWCGCGTCVSSENGWSLVVTCNHLFSDTDHPDGGFRDDVYPVKCRVGPGSDPNAKRYAAVAVAGDRLSDLALLVVAAELPAAELADGVPEAGMRLWRHGNGTGATETSVGDTKSRFAFPRFEFRATGEAKAGDSGAAYFDAKGRLVAVHCGLEDGHPRGTPAGAVRKFLDKQKATALKDAAEALKSAAGGGAAEKR